LDSLERLYQQLTPEQLASIESVAMDFWVPYIAATRRWLPDAERKIAFDKFHVAMHLSQAVDRVRRQEHGALRRRGDQRLKGTRYLWLENRRTMSSERRQSFEMLRRASLKTARAWMLKDLASNLWTYRRRGWARRAWHRWYASAIRSRLEPVKRAARNVKRYLEGNPQRRRDGRHERSDRSRQYPHSSGSSSAPAASAIESASARPSTSDSAVWTSTQTAFL
jgi:transposase